MCVRQSPAFVAAVRGGGAGGGAGGRRPTRRSAALCGERRLGGAPLADRHRPRAPVLDTPALPTQRRMAACPGARGPHADRTCGDGPREGRTRFPARPPGRVRPRSGTPPPLTGGGGPAPLCLTVPPRHLQRRMPFNASIRLCCRSTVCFKAIITVTSSSFEQARSSSHMGSSVGSGR